MSSPRWHEIDGQRLRRERLALALSHKELADRAGLAPGSIANWENGRNRIRADSLALLSAALGIKPEWLTTWPETDGKTAGNTETRQKAENAPQGRTER